MRPLQSIAMGLVVVALTARVHGHDLLADPLGWMLVVHGVAGLAEALPARSVVRGLALLALATSVPLWFPGVVSALEDTDESLLWTANLPQLAFIAALTAALARAATRSGDARAANWLRTAGTLTVAAALAPVVVYGAGEPGLLLPAAAGATMVLLLVIVLLFAWSGRPWALAPVAEPPGDATGAAPPGGGTAPAG